MSQAIIRYILNKAIREAATSPDSAATGGELRYGAMVKGIGWGTTLFSLGLSVGCLLMAPPEERLLTAGCFAVFMLMGVFLLMEGYGVRITYDVEGIRTRSPWRRSRRIGWSEVVSCDYSETNQCYRIHTYSQGMVRMPLMLQGVAGLLRMLPCEHPAYPPTSASGRSVCGPADLPVIVPGRAVPVKAKVAHVICWIFVALGVASLIMFPQSKPPVIEDFREVRGAVSEIQIKSGDKSRKRLRLRVPQAPALLVCSAQENRIQELLNVLHVGDEITALVSREGWENPRKPLFSDEAQIWMTGLKGDRWEFLRFEDHVASKKRDITTLLWGGIGSIVFGLGLRWKISRDTQKLNRSVG